MRRAVSRAVRWTRAHARIYRPHLSFPRRASRPVFDLSSSSSVKVYQVGGSVRDALLGLPLKDRDFVVVGATPQQMIDLGFKPVGRDFPVFLHPQTHAEYALARTE